jgi:hypothetical protein
VKSKKKYKVKVVKFDSAGIQINDKHGWLQGVMDNVLEKRRMKVR